MGIDKKGRAFGLFENGYFAWLIDNVRMLKKPIPDVQTEQGILGMERSSQDQVRESNKAGKLLAGSICKVDR